MKLCLISDSHTKHSELIIPECDILIHAGDITSNGELSTVYNFIQWLSEQPARYKVFIAGNHDWSFQDERRHKIHYFLRDYPNVIYLEDDYRIIEGIKIYGTPWQPWFYDWAFNAQRGWELREKWRLIPSDTDILVVHGPPHKHGDRCPNGDTVGCEDLLKTILKVQPKLVVSGHIHDAYGKHRITENILAVNASVMNEKYEVVNDPIALNYEDL